MLNTLDARRPGFRINGRLVALGAVAGLAILIGALGVIPRVTDGSDTEIAPSSVEAVDGAGQTTGTPQLDQPPITAGPPATASGLPPIDPATQDPREFGPH